MASQRARLDEAQSAKEELVQLSWRVGQRQRQVGAYKVKEDIVSPGNKHAYVNLSCLSPCRDQGNPSGSPLAQAVLLFNRDPGIQASAMI